MLSPVTPPSYLTISQSENCARADHTPCDTPPSHLAFKNALPKAFFQGARGFLGHEPPVPLHGPAIRFGLASLCVGHTNLR